MSPSASAIELAQQLVLKENQFLLAALPSAKPSQPDRNNRNVTFVSCQIPKGTDLDKLRKSASASTFKVWLPERSKGRPPTNIFLNLPYPPEVVDEVVAELRRHKQPSQSKRVEVSASKLDPLKHPPPQREGNK